MPNIHIRQMPPPRERLPDNGQAQPGILEKTVKLVYDSDKGGIQFGGLLGIAAGLFAGMKISAGAPSAALSLATVALTTLSFAWGGKKLGEMLGATWQPGGGQSPSVPSLGQGVQRSANPAAPAYSGPEIGTLTPPSAPRSVTPLAGLDAGPAAPGR